MTEETDLEKEEMMPSEEEYTAATENPVLEEDAMTVLQAQLAEQQEKYLRLFAEFDNFRRRTAKEKIDQIKTAGQDVILELLPVLDDFDRAEKSATEAVDIESYTQGLLLIKEKLYKALQSKGLKVMESVGKPFDPDFHEAITEVPVHHRDQKGKVMDEIEKGYFLYDKIIRYAKVVVGK